MAKTTTKRADSTPKEETPKVETVTLTRKMLNDAVVEMMQQRGTPLHVGSALLTHDKFVGLMWTKLNQAAEKKAAKDAVDSLE